MIQKTIKVADLVRIVNYKNQYSTCDARSREGWNDLLEEALLSVNQYLGFRYLPAFSVPTGQRPGIVLSKVGEHSHPDDTRREYIIP